MKVYIDKLVYQVLDEFYEASMKKHIALDLPTVIAKIDCREQAMYDFADKAEKIHVDLSPLVSKKNYFAKSLAYIKIYLYLCTRFEKKQKYQRLRHYFCMKQTTAYQHFTTGLTSECREYVR